MKILHIDHHVLFREGLRRVLQQLPGGVDEILEAGSFADGLRLAAQCRDLDMVLLELKSPGSEGAGSVKVFRQRYPYIPVMVVSSEEDYRVMNEAMGYGARGFIGKNSTGLMFLSALSMALSGIYMPPQSLWQRGMAVWNENNRNDKHRADTREYRLTPRQLHVLRCMAAGLSIKEIAGTINRAEGTVKAHVAAIYQTLHVNNRMDAVRVSGRLGLTEMSYV
ncbi:MAG: response regulator transcription factor [Gallionella sp.]|nr:response regulator transcription factor [Gallionella sp.]